MPSSIYRMKYKLVTFWLVVFCVLFAFLQSFCEYHFYSMEQKQLFLFTGSYLSERLALPGGLAVWIGEFLVQFFIGPYAGALITAALLTGVGVWTCAIVKRIHPSSDLFLLYLLPVLTLLFMHFDFNYLIQGTVAYIMLLKSLYGYIRIRSFNYRILYALILNPLLFWMGGPVAGLFALTVLLWEIMNRTPRGFWAGAVVLESLLVAVGSVWFSFIGEYRLAFLPDAYYHTSLEPGKVIYFSWICLLLILMLACLTRNRPSLSRKRGIAESLVQLLILVFLCGWGIPAYGDAKSTKLKMLDYYTRTGQSDRVIDACRGEMTNYLYMCHLNIALARKGELADQAFHFDQRGVQGLIVNWNKSTDISILLSDVYFTIGSIAPAQEMAFEGYISSVGEGNPRMLQRLVETNLIYGSYAVAEKYISVLEKTFFYREWAAAHRPFLYNDLKIEKDALLGAKRKCLLTENYLSRTEGFDIDLQRLAENNPSNTAPVQYLGVAYLLAKDMGRFKGMVETYYGTEVLPVLPISFQEAVITLSEKEPGYWKRFGIPESTVRRFADYKKQVLANKNNSAALPGLLKRSFGDTYWFYFMFK